MTYDHWKTTEPDDGREPPIQDEKADLLDHLDLLAQKAETAEQWAEIARLEAEILKG